MIGLAQGPFKTVHSKMFSPTARPVTEEDGSFGEVTIPAPLTSVQVPEAGKITLLPESVTVLPGVQISWSAPASASGLVPSNTKMLTRSVVTPHEPLSMDHSKMLSPTPRAVTVVFGSFGEVMVPTPEMRVQVPTAEPTGALPTKVTEATGVHTS